MPFNFSLTEPHPSVVKSGGYIGSGRGGAGNYMRYTSTDVSEGPNATGPAARVFLTKTAQRTVPSGRGGSGNMFTPSEADAAMFQFDEELVKRRESAAPTYHIGRGGAANWVDERDPRTQRVNSTDSTGSVNSDRSTSSGVRRSLEGAFGRLHRKVSKQ